jgi:septal ring factor EnvC (AmiA/AmiB activator)
MAGELDQLSQAIGRLEGLVEGIDRYTHEREHNIANLASKVDGLSQQITREVTRMKAELQVQLDAMDRRIAALEATGQQNAGAKNLVIWFLQSPLIGWIAAGILAFIALWKGKP